MLIPEPLVSPQVARLLEGATIRPLVFLFARVNFAKGIGFGCKLVAWARVFRLSQREVLRC